MHVETCTINLDLLSPSQTPPLSLESVHFPREKSMEIGLDICTRRIQDQKPSSMKRQKLAAGEQPSSSLELIVDLDDEDDISIPETTASAQLAAHVPKDQHGGAPSIVASDPNAVAMPSQGSTILHGMIRFCREINGFYSKEPNLEQTSTGADCVVGIHGMSGMGKTTLAKSLCYYLGKPFAQKVCFLDLTRQSLLESLKKVLKDLNIISKQSIQRIGEDVAQAWNLLEVYMKHQNKVFLVIDNIWEDECFVAQRVLKMKFTAGSKVLLTSRHMSVLRGAGVPVTCCVRMPFLTEEEAMGLFIQAGKLEIIDRQDHSNVTKWVSRCCYGTNNNSVKRFHPMALKVLADVATLDRRPSNWSDNNLNIIFPNESKNSVFDVFRIGSQKLWLEYPEYHAAFISLILFAPEGEFASIKPQMGVYEVENICKWLAVVHKMTRDKSLKFLQEMKAKMIVEMWYNNSNVSTFKIHDLYREFAAYELSEGRYQANHAVYGGDEKVPEELKMENPNVLQHGALPKELRLVKLKNCFELKAINLRCMNELRSLMVEGSPKLEFIDGLRELINLRWLVFNGCGRLKSIPDLTALSSCLQSLHVTHCSSVESIPGLENLTALLHLVLAGCSSLMAIPDLQNVKKLQFLNLSATGISEIPGIHALHELEELHLKFCDNLLQFPDLLSLPKLKKIFWRGSRVGRDGINFVESVDNRKSKRKFHEVDDDDHQCSEENSSSDKSSEKDSDCEVESTDNDEEAESEDKEENDGASTDDENEDEDTNYDTYSDGADSE